jgi:hypothetical protein
MSFVRTNTAASSELVSCDGARTTKWITPRSGNSVLEIQTYPDSSTITKVQRDQLSMPIPGLPVSHTINTDSLLRPSKALAPLSRRALYRDSRVRYTRDHRAPKSWICRAAISHRMSKNRLVPQDPSSVRESLGFADLSASRIPS